MVRQSLFFSLLLGGISHSDVLPDIEAHQFKAIPVEKSQTGRVYRFRVDPVQLPKTGNIVLIEEDNKPTMAFRVLKTDIIPGEFIGRRVRRYDTSSELKLNESYQTVEKIADLIAPPPPENEVYDPNAKPLLDPSSSVTTASPSQPDSSGPSAPTADATSKKAMNLNQYDDDLDSGTSPVNLKEKSTVENAQAPDAPPTEIGKDLEVRERSVLNPFNNMLGVSVVALRNYSNFIFGSIGGGGFTAYYSNVVKRNVFFKKEYPQDSLYLEYAFSYYSVINPSGNNDSYTFLPLRTELRYDLHLSETFTPLAYIGAQYNLIMQSQNANATLYNQINGFQLNLGVGLLFNIGPQWYLRADLGLDRLGIGLAVKW